ncbi:hypothetical protein E8E14_005111 [Neopestalotiopsis sp. 37M]|nr:hypothetical protein E8E14_005111 [Neopestalotiopsis sp. 37M]
MMDPMSALGIASAITTFIDFSWSLVTGTIEVHRNGAVNDDQDIGTIVSDLESIIHDLRKQGPGLTRAEKSVANLSEQCLATSQEIQNLLQPLMVRSCTKRTIWKSVKAQWTIMTGKEKIDELTSKLQGHREQLLLNLSLLLREDQSSLNIQMRAIQDSISDLNLDMSKKLTSLRDDLIEAVKMQTAPQPPPSCAGDETTSILKSLATIKKMIAHLQSSIVDMPIQQRILRQLAYEEMTSRHLRIREPEAGTLRWMFSQIYPLDQDSDVPTIMQKSQGVFLWTFLVVRQLLNALRNGDPLHVLRKRLNEVPQQLEEFYAKSLESVSRSRIDRTRASRMLLLALQNPLRPPLHAIAFSWIPDFDDLKSESLQDANFLKRVNLKSYSDAEIRRRLRRVTAQIRGLTRDFLEVESGIDTVRKKFVLEEVNLDPGLLGTKNDLNLLVSAAMRGHGYLRHGLGGKLLDLHADLDGTYPIRDEETGLTERWPVWIVVSIALIKSIMHQFAQTEVVRKVVGDLARINRYAIDQGWISAMTFKVWPEGRSMSHETSHTSRQINLGEVISFGQTYRPRLFVKHAGWAEFLLGSGGGIQGNFETEYDLYRVTWGSDN